MDEQVFRTPSLYPWDELCTLLEVSAYLVQGKLTAIWPNQRDWTTYIEREP